MKSVNRHADNNFPLVRWIGAILVFVGHMGHITQTSIPTYLGFQCQAIGVKMLFFLGGYFITLSWASDPSPLRYAIKRVTRLFPPLAVFVIAAAFIAGPLLSSLSLGEYFAHPQTYQYLLNLQLYIVYGLPGVFEHNLYPVAVNGSLWTMPVEAFMYVLVPVLIAVLRVKKENPRSVIRLGVAAAAVALGYLGIMLMKPQPVWVVYATPVVQAIQLGAYYLIGCLCANIRDFRHFKVEIALALIVLLPGLGVKSAVLQEAMLYVLLPYCVLSLGHAKTQLSPLFARYECTYSFYLYGFFFQQLTVDLMLRVWDAAFVQSHYTLALVVSGAVTFAVSVASYRYIEQPAIRLGKLLCRKVR